MTIEDVLDRTMQLDEPDAAANWADVGTRVRKRAVRRATSQRLGVGLLIATLGYLAFLSGRRPDVASGPLSQPEPTPGGLLDRWPSSSDVIAASLESPSSASMWLLGSIVLGLPLIIAWMMWLSAPDSMRQPSRNSRIGRWSIAIASGLQAAVGIAMATLLLLVFFYDPVSAAARATVLTDALVLASSGVWLWVWAFVILLMVPTDRGPVRWVNSTASWMVTFLAFLFAANIAYFAVTELRWDAVREVSPSRTPIRGLLAPMFSRDLQFEHRGAEVSGAYLLMMFGFVLVLAALTCWQARKVLRMAHGVEVVRWDRLSIAGVRRALQGQLGSVGLLVAGAGLLMLFFGSTFIAHDHVADDIPIPEGYTMEWVSVRRLSVLTDTSSPLVSATMRPIEERDESPTRAMERAVIDAGFARNSSIEGFPWSRERNDSYGGDLVGFTVPDDEDGRISVEATLVDRDGLRLAIPITLLGVALIAGGARSMRAQASRPRRN